MLTDAERLASRGLIDEARGIVDRVLAYAPDALDALSLSARLNLSQKRLDSALRDAARLCELSPESAASWHILGRVHRARGADGPAIDCYRWAIARDPACADYHSSLGICLRATGRLDEAIAAYHEALRIDPAHFAARHNLSNALAHKARGGADAAAAAASAPAADAVGALVEKGLTALREGRHADALRDAGAGLTLAPENTTLLEIALTAAKSASSVDVALNYFDRLSRVAPGRGLAVSGLHDAFMGATICGRTQDAQRYAASLLDSGAPPGEAQLLARSRALVLPAVNESRTSIDRARQAYGAALDELLEDTAPIAPDRVRLPILPSFFLAYHGLNDRDLMVKAARFWSRAVPSLHRVAPHCTGRRRKPGRIRIGLISAFLYGHSIGKTTEGLVRQLDRRLFEVYVLRIGPGVDDETTQRIRDAADHFIEISSLVFRDDSAARIAALELDVLFYQDIGMEPASYFLAFSRLAPVQCVSFGHPDTTGIPTLDWFISNDLYETGNPHEHYSESLHLLRDLPTLAYYYRPRHRNTGRTRADFGLPERGTLYICPQTLFKLHPDHDPLFREILERDATGHIVLIRGSVMHWYERLSARLDAALGPLSARVISVNAQPRESFLELLACCDVVLDTIHFNGMNTSLEAFSAGLPIVTLPTGLQRGRHTQAMYRKMALPDGIASDAGSYVDFAVRLGTDPDFNRSWRRLISERSPVLFENDAVVREFERFFLAAVEREPVAPSSTNALPAD